jgi:hypothetical protein
MRSNIRPALVFEVVAMSLFPAITLVFCTLLLFQVPTVATAVMEAVTTFPLWALVLFVALTALVTVPLLWVVFPQRVRLSRYPDAAAAGRWWDDRS